MQNASFPAGVKAKQPSAAIILLIFGIVFSLVGVTSLVNNLSPIPVPADIADITADTLADGGIYRIDDLLVGDVYAEYGESNRFTGQITNVEQQYFTAFLFDSTDTMYTISMEVKPSEAIMADINAYLEDEDLLLGDLSLAGYFEAEKMSSDAEEIYREMLDLYEEYELESTPIFLHLKYQCDLETDYAAFAAQKQYEARVINLVFMGLGAAALIGSIFAFKAAKKKQAAEAEKARARTTEEE